MSSKSKSQQRLFGWVHACQKGTAKNCPSSISKVASSISPEDAEDFARTKQKGLPERKKKVKKKKKEKESLKSFREFMDALNENLDAQNRGIASALQMTPEEEQQIKAQSSQILPTYVRKIGILLDKLEKQLGASTNNTAAENTDAWHAQALKLLYVAFKMAEAGGKRQWNDTMLRRNIQKGVTNAKTQQQQQQTQQQPQPNQNVGNAAGAGGGGGKGPTPLHQLA